MNVYSTIPEMSSPRRTQFAQAALRDAFRGRDLSLAREPNFIDLTPQEVASLQKGAHEHAY
jgi:hypothetical protein